MVWLEKLPSAMWASLLCISAIPDCSTFKSAPWKCVWENSRRWPESLGPCRTTGRSSWLLISVWCNPGCCSHLRNEPNWWKISLALSLPLSLSYMWRIIFCSWSKGKSTSTSGFLFRRINALYRKRHSGSQWRKGYKRQKHCAEIWYLYLNNSLSTGASRMVSYS